MSSHVEPTFTATGEAETHRRLAEIRRRRLQLAEQFAANEREYQELRTAEAVLDAEESSLRARLAARDAA